MIIFTLLYFLFYKLYKTRISKFIFLLYGLIFLSSIFFDTEMFWLSNYPLKTTNILLLIASILLIIYPLNHKVFNNLTISDISRTKLNKIFVLVGICGFLSTIYFIPYAIKVSLINADDVRKSLGDSKNVLPDSVANTIFTAFSQLYIFYLYFFFISIKIKSRLFVKIILLVASLSYIVNSIAFAARDGYVIYLLSFIVFTIYFKKGKFLRVRYLLFFAPFLYITYIITTSRFGELGTESFLIGTLGYIGQQPYVFNEALEQNITFYGLDLRLPLFSFDALNSPPRLLRFERMFGTWILDLYMISGLLSLIVGIIIMNLIPKYIQTIQKRTELGANIIKVIFLQYLIQGVFYFRSGNVPGNIVLVTVFVISLFIYANSNKNKKYV